MNSKATKLLIRLAAVVAFAFTVAVSGAAEAAKQPVFLLCPHTENFSAWSLFLDVDPNDPSKIRRLVLEELSNMNSKEASYEKVQAAQRSSDGKREQIAELSAEDFGRKELRVNRNDALHVALESIDNQTYRMNLSLRVGMSDRFVIGGKNRKKNNVILRFNNESKMWGAFADVLTDPDGKNILKSGEIGITGVNFPVASTGIYTIVGVLQDSTAVKLLDRSWNPDK